MGIILLFTKSFIILICKRTTEGLNTATYIGNGAWSALSWGLTEEAGKEVDQQRKEVENCSKVKAC